MHQPTDSPRSSAGRNVGARPVGKGQQPDLVVADQGDVRQQQHGVERVVQG